MSNYVKTKLAVTYIIPLKVCV